MRKMRKTSEVAVFKKFVWLFVMVLAVSQTVAAFGQENPRPLVFRADGGKIVVEDGDSFWLGIHWIRLHGIDALEPQQTCSNGSDGKNLGCAERAKQRLTEFVLDPAFKCQIHYRKEGKPWISHSRYLGTCFVGGTNINQVMVKEGHAFADPSSFGNEYREFEEDAKSQRIGIHAIEKFDLPWVFRKGPLPNDVKCPTGTHQCVRIKKHKP